MKPRNNVIYLSERFRKNGQAAPRDDPFEGYVFPSFEVSDIKMPDGTVITKDKIRAAARQLAREYWRPLLGYDGSSFDHER